jgi:hypothetical protein
MLAAQIITETNICTLFCFSDRRREDIRQT